MKTKKRMMKPTDLQRSTEHDDRRLEAPPTANGRGAQRRRAPDREFEERLRSLRDALRMARQGDLSIRLPTDGASDAPFGEVALAFNSLIEENAALVGELDRVCRTVGLEGEISERASLGPVSGAWAAAVASLNTLIESMAYPTTEATRVLGLVANGDLSREMREHVDGHPLRGDFLQLESALNLVVQRLRFVSTGVSHVIREIGTEGKLGSQASVQGLSGTWKDLVDDVNLLSNNLTAQVRNIALVSTAIANGDLSQKITVETRGEILELKNAINATVDRLRSFAAEVIRVAREVGTEGKLGAQADVRGVSGVWEELTDSVNHLASNLTSQVRNIAQVADAIAKGDLSQQFIVEAKGEIAALADTINNMTETLRTFAAQVTTVAREVGIEGKLGGQALVPGVAGTWKDLTDNVNMLAANLTNQVRSIALVTTAVANGDLSKTITVEAKGEILELKNTINAMVEQLRTFAAEVTRVAREVGTDGQLGGQARVPGVSGTWKDLTDNVNVMASNLTDQVRSISKIVTAVAHGDLTNELVLVAKGEIATLADTINDMTETLRTFAEQVTTVAREVGVQGKLGGQAKVPGAAGTWRDLTDNVNQLAANLTTQVRAIAEVATAVTQGDLSRTIAVEARGEVLSLKDTINQMIANLRDTTRTNREQDWLKTNLAKFFSLLQGQRNVQSLTDSVLSELTPTVGAQQAVFYLIEEGEQPTLKLASTYAFVKRKQLGSRFAVGEGLIGQCASERKPIVLAKVPDDHIPIVTALGESAPRNIAVFPVLFEDKVLGVIELASFYEFTQIQLTFIEQLMLNVGLAINLIGTSMRTQELVQQFQASNVELDKQRGELEEKAQELARVSQYKSQFLANMSHEIRTPLNSMMILAQMLGANEDKNLTPQQREWAETIYSGGRDLLVLINQLLDLSKVEAGRIQTHVEIYPTEAVREFAEQTFRPVAMEKQLEFSIDIAPAAPATLTTDRQLVEQILKNLLSNAFKFTERGRVTLQVDRAPAGTPYPGDRLGQAETVVAFSVSDTGVGIPPDKLEAIFEAFEQADDSITRKFGGTGLGLNISREYARILGGAIGVQSTMGGGSAFTLYLPVHSSEPLMHSPERAPGGAMRAPEGGAPSGPVTPEEMARLAGRKILVVEDDIRSTYAITSFLERYGATVVPASSAKEAYACLEENPDTALIILDIMMPGVDGYEATRVIRSMPTFANIPIIAHTAKASEPDLAQCIGAGCTDVVVKPADNRQLLSLVVRNLPVEGKGTRSQGLPNNNGGHQ
jgi:signal transduction histidine kinase/HAMP domain-containing protein/CheY-like chemotaxis protein